MSSFEKVVKNACKPKPAPPKAKVCSLRFCRSTVPPQLLSDSISIPSSQPHGPRTEPFMTSAEPSLPAFESQILSSVRSSHLLSRRIHRWADTPSGGVQGAHRSPYHDSERLHRQCTSVFVFFGGFTIKERSRRSMGRYVLVPGLIYSIISLCHTHTFLFQVTTHPQIFSITLCTLTPAYVHTAT